MARYVGRVHPADAPATEDRDTQHSNRPLSTAPYASSPIVVMPYFRGPSRRAAAAGHAQKLGVALPCHRERRVRHRVLLRLHDEPSW